MALIVNETKSPVIVGIQNLARGVYSHHVGSIMIVNGTPRYDPDVQIWFNAISVNNMGEMAIPSSRWDDVSFTRIADSVDIVVPGRA